MSIYEVLCRITKIGVLAMDSSPQGDSLLRIVLIILAIIVLFPILMMAFAMPMMRMMGWWGSGGSQIGLSPLWGIGVMVLFLAILLGIGYFLYRSIMEGQVHSHDRALEELRIAYARGELDDEEYEQRRNRLQQEYD